MKKIICLILMFFSIATISFNNVFAIVGDQVFIEIIKEKFKNQENISDYINIDFDSNFNSEKYKCINFTDWINKNFKDINGFKSNILNLSNNGQNRKITSENPLESWALALFVMYSNINSRINGDKTHEGILEYYFEMEYEKAKCSNIPLNESVYKICNGFWKVCNEAKSLLIERLCDDEGKICEANMNSLKVFFERISLYKV